MHWGHKSVVRLLMSSPLVPGQALWGHFQGFVFAPTALSYTVGPRLSCLCMPPHDTWYVHWV